MPKAIVIRQYGAAGELKLEDVTLGNPGPGQVRLRQGAVGVNFHDIYVRSGLYKTLALPGVPGVEAAGVIEAVGEGVGGFKVGDRAAYVTQTYGAYADVRLIDAAHLMKVPGGIDDRTLAASMVKGLTALMLTSKLRPLTSRDTCLVYAAAGGVGQVLCQMARRIGARVIGVVGGADKVARARAAGCDDVILRTEADVAAEVMALTKGRGVDIVYDSVGKDTFEASLDVLALRGHLVNFGQASGPVAPFTPARLAAKSNAVWRPILFHFLADPVERQAMADEFFAAVLAGAVKVEVGASFGLGEAPAAHQALESGATTNSIILIP
ncbi:MAG: quinone oxidoreductase [Proteobacteria bacterium]|nr:quinone oxidoreductase [Pseudomonadota bacterium]